MAQPSADREEIVVAGGRCGADGKPRSGPPAAWRPRGDAPSRIERKPKNAGPKWVNIDSHDRNVEKSTLAAFRQGAWQQEGHIGTFIIIFLRARAAAPEIGFTAPLPASQMWI